MFVFVLICVGFVLSAGSCASPDRQPTEAKVSEIPNFKTDCDLGLCRRVDSVYGVVCYTGNGDLECFKIDR